MNAGTPKGTIGDRVALVSMLCPDGGLRAVPGEEGGFGYRDSLFRRLGIPVLGVALRPGVTPPGSREEPLAARRATQPLDLPSAGCVFKNPKDAPPAGWLIDRAGLKGARVGDAVVSPRHANFICNLGHARASEVLALVDRVRHCVVKAFGVWLELELDVVTA
jgi:UDP-N-acetylmuramate dehydrogenase